MRVLIDEACENVRVPKRRETLSKFDVKAQDGESSRGLFDQKTVRGKRRMFLQQTSLNNMQRGSAGAPYP